MKVLALDVGTTETGYCVVDSETRKPLEFGKVDNDLLLDRLMGHYPIDFDVLLSDKDKLHKSLKETMMYLSMSNL